MARNKTNLLYARAYKNGPKRKEASVLKLGLWLWPRNKTAVIVVEESSSCHPGELRQMKSDFKSMLSLFLNSEAVLQKFFLSSVPACESTVLHRSTKGFYGSCWEIMPDKWHTQDWLLHHDNMPCHTDSWLFLVPNQNRWWWYLVSVLLHPSLHGLFWFSKIETWLKGWSFKDMKTKLNRKQHWSALQNWSFRGVSSRGRDAG